MAVPKLSEYCGMQKIKGGGGGASNINYKTIFVAQLVQNLISFKVYLILL